MPQWRKLHVKATESMDINDMPDDFHRLLWLMLPLGLDKEGRGMDNPSWIKAKTMPLRLDVTHKMIETAMSWYSDRSMIRRYTVGGRGYFYIPTFSSYQNTEREAESNYPAPIEDETNSGVSQELVATKSSLDKNRVDKNRIEEKENPAPILLAAWRELFPKKPQPKETTQTIREKVAARWKSADFRENWLAAMQQAAASPSLQKESWFNFLFFVRNDDNYQKCLDNWMEWKDKQQPNSGISGKIQCDKPDGSY